MNAKFEGKAAIHCAAIAGKFPVMKVLVEFSANIELKVCCNKLNKHDISLLPCRLCQG